MTNQGLLILLLLSCIVIYLVWDTYFQGNMTYVKSTVDDKEYMVQELPDKQEAANLLANISANLNTLILHLTKISPDDERTKQIKANYRPDQISEGSEQGKFTSYSINKGERIVFCLRSKDEQKVLMDLNTMMFVALHELAHVGTKSTGHTEEFWDNFKWLLEEAIQIGIYKQQDFKTKPIKYCGTNITSSPLDN